MFLWKYFIIFLKVQKNSVHFKCKSFVALQLSLMSLLIKLNTFISPQNFQNYQPTNFWIVFYILCLYSK